VAQELALEPEALQATEAEIQADGEESLPPPPPLVLPAPRYQPKVLAITGTNGKTTVTALTGQLVQRAGKRVAICGNIGPSLLDTLAECLDAQEAARLEAEADVAAQAKQAEQAAQEQAQAAGAPAGSVAHVELASEAAGPAGAPAAPKQSEAAPSPNAAQQNASLPEVWVLELSSFQLEGVTDFEPTAATVLNLSQDHLDWHGSMDAYAQAKANIFGQRGLMLLNRDDAAVMAMLPAPAKAPGKNPFKPKVQRAHQTFSTSAPERPGDWGIETVNGMAWLVRAAEADETFKPRKGEEIPLYVQRLMPVDALHIRGLHNATNALAALALGAAAGCNIAPMLHGLRDYRGEPHRVESIAVVQDVEYFDDSKGTNVGATVAALKGLGASRQLVLILGGEGKGQDFSPLAEPVSRYVRAVVLIGRDAPLIRAALADTGVALLDADTLPRAVEIAAARAQPGDAVLMSPACASFDMFKNYGHRGQVFCDAVRELALDAGVMA
jgi:UDP-N-acetylmuramoylalanine--D-glutamate ligase